MKPGMSLAAVTLIALFLGGCSVDETDSEVQQDTPASTESAAQAEAIDWFQGSVEEAFALAEAEDKPLFLYWGAEWCPYCKQLEATIFIRAEFIRLSRQFVPLDLSNGDSEVIRYADEYKVFGLPTVIVFSPAGEELTRIRGGMDMEQYASVLELTLNAVRPVASLVAAAVAGETLSAADWQLLANYSWGQDRGQALGEENPAQVMLDVLAACPESDSLTRGRLALAAMEVWLDQDEESRDSNLGTVHLQAVEAILADKALASDNLMALAGYGSDIVELAEEEQQLKLQQALLSLYKPAIEDSQLHLLNRASVLSGWAEVATALLDEGENLDAKTVEWGRAHADEMVAKLDQYQVHAGVNSLWGVYYDLGLEGSARDTLALGIERSKAPFYFMSGMGYLEVQAGNNEAALAWYRKAWETTSNPVDRAGWGGGYVRRLLKLAPEDSEEIERASSELIADLTNQTDGLEVYERLINSLGESLLEWSAADAKRQQVVATLREQMTSQCAAIESEQAGGGVCSDFLRPAPA